MAANTPETWIVILSYLLEYLSRDHKFCYTSEGHSESKEHFDLPKNIIPLSPNLLSSCSILMQPTTNATTVDYCVDFEMCEPLLKFKNLPIKVNQSVYIYSISKLKY